MSDSAKQAAASAGVTSLARSRLQAEPVNWRSWEFRVMNGDQHIATLDLARFRTRGEFQLGSDQFEVAREGLLASSYVLRLDGRIVARTERASLVPVVLSVIGEDRRLTLHSRFGFRAQFVIKHGDHVIGAIKRPGIFRRRFVIETVASSPLHLNLFMLVVALLTWRQRARAAS